MWELDDTSASITYICIGYYIVGWKLEVVGKAYLYPVNSAAAGLLQTWMVLPLFTLIFGSWGGVMVLQVIIGDL